MTPQVYNASLKDLAKLYGFDPSRVSSHSLRVGGASALAAAGLPEYLIKEMGSWRSNAFLTYLRTCLQTFSDAQDVMCNSNKFSLQMIRAFFCEFLFVPQLYVGILQYQERVVCSCTSLFQNKFSG